MRCNLSHLCKSKLKPLDDNDTKPLQQQTIVEYIFIHLHTTYE